MREIGGDDFVAVDFESDGDVSVDGEEVVDEDNVVLSRCH